MDRIELLGTSMLIKRDIPLTQTASGIFVGESTDKPDTGTIVMIGPEAITNLVGKRVRFRETFATPLQIDGEEFLYFVDIESPIYYIINE